MKMIIKEMRSNKYDPEITWKIECYHFEEKTEYYTDSDGIGRTRKVTEKIVTHRAQKDYSGLFVNDFEIVPDQVANGRISGLTVHWSLSGNHHTSQKKVFVEENDKDEHQSVTESIKFRNGVMEKFSVAGFGTSPYALWLFRSHFAVLSRYYMLFDSAIRTHMLDYVDEEMSIKHIKVSTGKPHKGSTSSRSRVERLTDL
jgi:hypothetical protein